MSEISVERSTEQWRELLTGHYLLFGLLGKLFYSMPDADLIRSLVQDGVFEETPSAADQPTVISGLSTLQEWSRDYAEEPHELLADIQADYTRLFVVTERLPVTPWESVYYNDERLLFQSSTVDVRHWYARYGLEPVKGRREPEDHIGLELAFVAHLARRALLALEAGNDENFQDLLSAERAFCEKHLMVWAPLWCDQMVEYARTPFYRGLALVLRGALHELSAVLDIPVREGDTR